MKLRNLLIVVVCFAYTISNAQTITDTKFGKGLINFVAKDSSFSVKFAPRFQVRSISSWDHDGNQYGSPEHNFIVRRARLKFDGYVFDPSVVYKLELGLSNRDTQSGSVSESGNTSNIILDAALKWTFAKNWTLWVGQTKLPGNRERVISSGDLQQVDRSLLNSRFNIDRDMGFQLRHHFNLTDTFIVKEMFAVSQGEGRNITTGNLGGHQYTSRIELLPFGKFASKGDYRGSDLKFEPVPKLALGFTYDFNNDAVKNRSNQGSYMTNDTGFYSTNISTVFVDAMYKHKGFSVMAEYAYRDAEDAFAKNSDGTLTGDLVQVGNALNLQTGYLLSKTLEISGRYTNIDWDSDITGKGAENQYTLGLSKYIVGHKLKVQTDVSYLDLATKTNQFMYRLQVDIHF